LKRSIRLLGVSRAARWRLPLLLLLAGLLLALRNPTHAQQSGAISMRARAGFDGYVQANTWLPVRVTVANSGPDVSGVLVDPIIRYRLYRESVTAILSAVFALTVLAGLYPAYRAGRIPPVENLKTI